MKIKIRFLHSVPELLLAVLLIACMFLGGSGRDDAVSLVLLRPISVFALAVALCILPREVARRNRALIACAFAAAVLVVLQLVPLPPVVWQSLPGRELSVAIDKAAGMPNLWRPISQVPYRTLNALIALAVPLAVLLLALMIDRERYLRLGLLLLAGTFVSALLGLLQLIGGDGNPFYLYRITNDGSAVGFFANRNHQSVMLALGFPLTAATVILATAIHEERSGVLQWVGLAFGALLLPSLLVAQSRAGMVLGLVGVASVLFVLNISLSRIRNVIGERRVRWKISLLLLAFVLLAILSIQMTASNSFDRLFSQNGVNEASLRFNTWPVALKLALDNLPFGTGMGTFVEVYGVVEPDFMLRPQYMNHAHNDFIELLLTGGLPFVVLVVVSLLTIVRGYFFGLESDRSERSRTFRRVGVVFLLVMALASAYDYPLRAPLMAAIFALALAWTAGRSMEKSPTHGNR